MSYLKRIYPMRNVVALKIFIQVALFFFHFLSRKYKCSPFGWVAGSWAMNIHGCCLCALHKPSRYIKASNACRLAQLWRALRSFWWWCPHDCPAGLEAAHPQEGRKTRWTTALQPHQLSETTGEGGCVPMSQAGIWSGWDMYMSLLASPVTGGCLLVGQGSSVTPTSFSRWQSSGPTVHLSQHLLAGKISQTSLFELLIGKQELLAAFDTSFCSLSALWYSFT